MGQEILRFNLFGHFSASYGGKEIKLDRSGSSKAIQLLAMIVYRREGVTRSQLFDNLYGDKDLADRSNNMRVTMHKLRKMLSDAGLPDGKYIVSKGDTYRWDPDIPVYCDVWEFGETVIAAEEAQTYGNTGQEINLRRQASELYKGEFLQQLSGEDWVTLEAVPMKQKYTANLKRLCTLLNQQKKYDDIVDLCSAAQSIYPYDEWCLYKIDAYIEQNRFDEALEEYQDFTRRYFEDLGLSPTEDMLARYRKICEKPQRKFDTVEEIYWELTEKPAASGGDYVSPMNFIDRFRFLQRISERSGESNYLVVVSLYKQGGTPKEEDGFGRWPDELMRHVMRKCLRRADSFTKYNGDQYLMLLVGIDLESVNVVTKRIDHSISHAASGWKLKCTYRAVPLRPQLTSSMDFDHSEVFGWDLPMERSGV